MPTLWSDKLAEWVERYGCKTFPPVDISVLGEVEAMVGPLPTDLRNLYQLTNGVSVEGLRVLPVETPSDIKRTWDGLRRANDLAKTQFLGRDPNLLGRFLIFAVLRGNACAALDRGDSSIWYEEGGELHQTDFDLAGFLDAALKELRGA
jgi:hypothetical protein